MISIGYLALTPQAATQDPAAAWSPWTRFFPWEDWRGGRPAVIDEALAPRLATWSDAGAGRAARARSLFALDGAPWNEERVLDRYELLYEPGWRRRRSGIAAGLRATISPSLPGFHPAFGQPMVSDHRRILATGLGRLRGKLKYRPIVFELMPETFTLYDLQRAVEAIAGVRLHKQNFRRMVERTGPGRGLRPYPHRDRRAPGRAVPLQARKRRLAVRHRVFAAGIAGTVALSPCGRGRGPCAAWEGERVAPPYRQTDEKPLIRRLAPTPSPARGEGFCRAIHAALM